MDAISITLNIIFSLIGTAYLIYGKKAERWNFGVFGAVLIFWPYFFSNVWIDFLGGVILIALPFLVDF